MPPAGPDSRLLLARAGPEGRAANRAAWSNSTSRRASMVDLVPTVEPRVDTGTNVDHFCLGIETDDLGSVISYLRSNSVEMLGEPAIRYGARGMGNSIYVRDPEGNIIELKQTPSQGQATLG